METRKLSILLIAALIGTFTARAQPPDRPMIDPKEMVTRTIEELSEHITLTPAIQDSLKTTFLRFFDVMRKEREAGNRPDRQAMESKMDAKVKTFLTEEQFKIYQEFMEERRSRRGSRPDGPPQGPGNR